LAPTGICTIENSASQRITPRSVLLSSKVYAVFIAVIDLGRCREWTQDKSSLNPSANREAADAALARLVKELNDRLGYQQKDVAE
jgi:hypothetical protein